MSAPLRLNRALAKSKECWAGSAPSRGVARVLCSDLGTKVLAASRLSPRSLFSHHSRANSPKGGGGKRVIDVVGTIAGLGRGC